MLCGRAGGQERCAFDAIVDNEDLHLVSSFDWIWSRVKTPRVKKAGGSDGKGTRVRLDEIASPFDEMREKFDEMRKEVHRGAAVITDGGGGCRPEVKGWEAGLNKYSVNYALDGGKYVFWSLRLLLDRAQCSYLWGGAEGT